MQKVTHKGYEISLREATVGDSLATLRISRLVSLDVPEDSLGFYTQFGELCSQTEDGKNLGFDPAAMVTATEAEIKAAYEQFLTWPERFRIKIGAALTALKEDDDPATGRDPLPKDAPKNS